MVSSSVFSGIQERVSVSSAYSQAPFLLFSLFDFNVLVFILSLYIIFYFIFYCYLFEACLFSDKEQKGCASREKGKERGAEKSERRENHNEDILCKKKIYFQ